MLCCNASFLNLAYFNVFRNKECFDMTRINVVPVEELTNKHLMAEYHEITRIFRLVREAQNRGINKYNIDYRLSIPIEYTLGKGHVLFFYNKLRFILNRYKELQFELRSRNYNINPIDDSSLIEGIRMEWLNDYIPTNDALDINRTRIFERLASKLIAA